MNPPTTQRLAALGATALLVSALAVPALAAGPVTVQLNGNTLNLNPAPTERAGRVFVPLRGVFENLGASVVYQGGVINATGRGHNISLRIGSQTATVDGQQQTIDVAPFIIGASTYVPLRFVSQALGATVNWDNANRVVAIVASGANVVQNPGNGVITPAPASNGYGGGGAITLRDEMPGRGASVTARRPTIGATFAGATADATTVRVLLDGNDITNDSTRSPRGFLYVPHAALTPGHHTVQVSGTDSNGGPFTRGWGFNSGTSNVAAGQITNVRPTNGSTVANTFTITGRTSPGARVAIQVGTSGGQATVGGLLGAILGVGGQSNTASTTVTADGNGRFSQQVTINAPSGTQLVLAITSTDPATGASGTPYQENLTIQ
ncbi:MAG TPA: copper amine oxidase N-terminal domain-containing protein [Candidatus Limnocylindrales bacterium]|nr:copper amine oxidase N-terminal domain-containing protein [Candidatus Limnocylindrales bacterium]